jgi:alcohol dehydrogenase class IV
VVFLTYALYALNTQVIFGEGSIPALTKKVKELANSGSVAIITDDDTGSNQLDFLQCALSDPSSSSNITFDSTPSSIHTESNLSNTPDNSKGSPSLKPVPQSLIFQADRDLTIAEAEQLTSELSNRAVRYLIAIGGDCAMNLAKSVAAMLNAPGITNFSNIEKSGLVKVICIPTNPGTGAELVSEVIRTETETSGHQQIYHGAGLAPDWTVYDIQLISMTPDNLIREKVAAGLCQAVEALVSAKSNEVTDALAISAAKNLGLLQNRLEVGCNSDRELLSKVTNGAMLAALARQSAGHGAAQALARWITGTDCGLERLGQGQKRYAALAAAFLPLVMRYNMPQSHEKYAVLAGIWGMGSRGDTVDQAAQAIRHIMNVNRRAGIPAQLRAFGFDKALLAEAVECTENIGLMEGNPRPVNNRMLVSILEEGW